jgi:ppGpp synthetase/RelA/SpoT-type nucleotidyltranferase
MDLHDYELRGHLLYGRFASTVAAILQALAAQVPKARLQQIQHRAKASSSLRKKLEGLGQTDAPAVEAEILDLAGCRMIFYTNADVQRFLQTRPIFENFEAVKVKVHYPDPQNKDPNNQFIAYNYTVALREDRAALAEYADFAGLRCEVQIQTPLQHAWSEMAHDTIYKVQLPEGFGSEQRTSVAERLKRIMQDHLLPAGFEFQKVDHDVGVLTEGMGLYSQGLGPALEACADNNDRFHLLERFFDFTQPFYDDPPKAYPDVVTALETTIPKARAEATVSIKTEIGELPGYGAGQVERQAAQILERWRYIDVERSFQVAVAQFMTATDADARKRWLQVIEALTKNQLTVWRQVGPGVQKLLLDLVEAMPDFAAGSARTVAMTVLTAALDPEVTEHTGTYDTVTLHRGAVAPNELVREVRAQALRLAEQLFRASADEPARRQAMQLFAQATRTPYAVDYTNGLLATVLHNSLSVMAFYTEAFPTLSLATRQQMARDGLYLLLRSRGVVIADEQNADLKREVEGLKAALEEAAGRFRTLVEADQDLTHYDLFIGVQPLLPEEWDGAPFDFELIRAYRRECHEAIIARLNADTLPGWLDRLRRYLADGPSDGLSTTSVGDFLRLLAETKPDLGLHILTGVDEALSDYLPNLALGLQAQGRGAEVDRVIRGLVDAGALLGPVIWFLSQTAAPDGAVISDAVKAAIQQGDDRAVECAIELAGRQHDKVAGGLIDSVLMPAADYLAAKDKLRWVEHLWHYDTTSKVLADLDEAQADRLVAHLVNCQRVDFGVEHSLVAIAGRWPAKIIAFFEARLARGEDLPGYEALPYQLQKIPQLAPVAPADVLSYALRWFTDQPVLFPYRAGRLVSLFFPALTEGFQAALVTFLHAHADVQEFVLKVLETYRGELDVGPVAREVVATLPEGDPLLSRVQHVLTMTGVVRGEFGFVEAYKVKRDAYRPWLDDARPAVRAFAGDFIRYLDQMIASDQRQSEERMELQKRAWE